MCTGEEIFTDGDAQALSQRLAQSIVRLIAAYPHGDNKTVRAGTGFIVFSPKHKQNVIVTAQHVGLCNQSDIFRFAFFNRSDYFPLTRGELLRADGRIYVRVLNMSVAEDICVLGMPESSSSIPLEPSQEVYRGKVFIHSLTRSELTSATEGICTGLSRDSAFAGHVAWDNIAVGHVAATVSL